MTSPQPPLEGNTHFPHSPGASIRRGPLSAILTTFLTKLSLTLSLSLSLEKSPRSLLLQTKPNPTSSNRPSRCCCCWLQLYFAISHVKDVTSYPPGDITLPRAQDCVCVCVRVHLLPRRSLSHSVSVCLCVSCVLHLSHHPFQKTRFCGTYVYVCSGIGAKPRSTAWTLATKRGRAGRLPYCPLSECRQGGESCANLC